MHAYRSIAETKIFSVSLIYHLYVKKERWVGKNLCYRKIKYITSNTGILRYIYNNHIFDNSIQINIKFLE